MNHILKFLFVFLLTSAFYSCTPPQDFVNSPEHFLMFEKNRFYIDPVVFLDKDSLKPRLDLYICFPSDNILFKKTGANGNYEMKLNVSVSLLGIDSSVSVKKNYKVEALYSEDEMKRISKEPRFFYYSFFPEPGKYKLDVKMRDENAKREYKKFAYLNIENYASDNFSCSDIMVLSTYKENENGTKEISPLITNNISRLNDVYVFFEIYSKSDSLTKQLVFKLKNPKGEYFKEEFSDYVTGKTSAKIFRKILSAAEIKKYIPGKKDFEDFDPDDKNFASLLLEIWDRQENKLLAVKRLSVLPEKTKIPPMMEKRGQMR